MELDKKYYPMADFYRDFTKDAEEKGAKEVVFSLERELGALKKWKASFYKDGNEAKNLFFAERLIKTLLYCYGGYKLGISDKELYVKLSKVFSKEGARAFDVDMMEKIYRMPFEVFYLANPDALAEKELPTDVAGFYDGNRIGFDAGGSDRKVTAVKNGEVVFQDETVWFPKLNADPEYHKAGIEDSIERAKAALGGKVDCIGVSTAGVVIDDEIRVASLFYKVPEEIYAEKVVPIYKNLGKKYGVPVKVANDGDVTALAGAVAEGTGCVLGVAMGTSEAAGYIDEDGRIRGYINELAFVPVDANEEAFVDEWSGDFGTGASYLSQDGVNKLLAEAEIPYDASLSPAEKLKIAQKLANEDDPRGIAVFRKVGEYFGNSILYYAMFYKLKKVLFLGRVASGKGGDLVMSVAQNILDTKGDGSIRIVLPDEKSRRLGQSYTAAGLVKL